MFPFGKRLACRFIAPTLALCGANCAYSEMDDIVVKLTPESKVLLQNKLKSMKLGEIEVDSVVISRQAHSSVVSDLSALYGNRVAFRMKGYVKTKCGKSKNCVPKFAVS